MTTPRIYSGQSPLGPAAAYTRHATGRRALVFCSTIEEAEQFASEFKALGIPAACVHAFTPPRDVSVLVSIFNEGKLPVLLGVNLLFDLQVTPDAVIIARPVHNKPMWYAILGKLHGQQDTQVFDLYNSALDIGVK